MSARKDPIFGEMHFGVQVLELAYTKPKSGGKQLQRYYRCKCHCGDTWEVEISTLRKGRTRSCGCTRRLARGINHGNGTHGMSTTVIYRTWCGMRARCLNPHNHSYPDWGGRGITICARWMIFENFYADMGDKPHGKSLDRINVNGNYEPGNCRWATPLQQQQNRRKRISARDMVARPHDAYVAAILAH